MHRQSIEINLTYNAFNLTSQREKEFFTHPQLTNACLFILHETSFLAFFPQLKHVIAAYNIFIREETRNRMHKHFADDLVKQAF